MNRQILLIIGGGIAAYKIPELVRAIAVCDVDVRCLVTAAGAEFVAPLTLASLSGMPVYENLFDLKDEAEMGHIQLSREADMIVVAPATADLIAKMANGIANDLASTTLLASDKPIVIVPAMNVRMWEHVATQRNLAQLKADGVSCIGPEAGDMACGEYGMGRMVEPQIIANDIVSRLALGSEPHKELSGRRIIITAGPTHEPIDPVRYIANHSSGQQGYALARAFSALGADVVLVSGPTNLPSPSNMTVIYVITARDMYDAVLAHLPADCVIMCAAIADWRPADMATQKLKKPKDVTMRMQIEFVQNLDILATLATKPHRPELLIGFAAETENIIERARKKRAHKKCDWIVANDVSPSTKVFGGTHNRIHLITGDGTESWDEMPKDAVAEKLAKCVVTFFVARANTHAKRVG